MLGVQVILWLYVIELTFLTFCTDKFWKDLLPESASRSHADCLNLSRENETCKALASLSVNNKSKLERERSLIFYNKLFFFCHFEVLI